MIIVIWVDDMIISGCKLGSIVCFKSWFGEHFELMDLGKLKYMLSILVEHNHTNCLIYILQKSYLKQVLECFGMSDLHPVSTPLAVGRLFHFLNLSNLKKMSASTCQVYKWWT